MSDIKLIHYNVKGKAETSRLILAYAGVEYEDKRIEPGKKIQKLIKAQAMEIKFQLKWQL